LNLGFEGHLDNYIEKFEHLTLRLLHFPGKDLERNLLISAGFSYY
jgi:hypothetical protein